MIHGARMNRFLLAMLLLSACQNPVRCGGAESALAMADTPDTSFTGAGRVYVQVAQQDPYLGGGTTVIAITQVAANGVGLPPRVRLVAAGGNVLVDAVAEWSGGGWRVQVRTSQDQLRRTLVDGLRDQTIALELWKQQDSLPSTLLQPVLEFSEISPVGWCS